MSAFQSSPESTPLSILDIGLPHEAGRQAAGHTSTRPKKKRLNHNELERKRRHHQREVLYELRDVIPTLHIVKPSTVLIMQKAKDYIDLLRRTIQEMDIEINDLRRALVAAGYPLPMQPIQQQQALCGFSAGPPAFSGPCQSSTSLSEQVLSVPQQTQLSIDQSSQLPFAAFGDIALGRSQFDSQDIESIGQLQSVLSKSAAELSTGDNRPISPVSPYQLEQAQSTTSGEFKRQLRSIQGTPNEPAATLTTAPCMPVFGTQV